MNQRVFEFYKVWVPSHGLGERGLPQSDQLLDFRRHFHREGNAAANAAVHLTVDALPQNEAERVTLWPTSDTTLPRQAAN